MKDFKFKYKHIGPIPELPIVTRRQLELSDALYHGEPIDLAYALVRAAKQDRDKKNLPTKHAEYMSVCASMNKLISGMEDKDGLKEVVDIIHATHPLGIEAIIWGTIGHEYKTDPDFRKLLYDAGISGYGIYCNTPIVKDHIHPGKSCINELVQLTDMLTGYHADWNRLVPRHSASAAIDRAYGEPPGDDKNKGPWHGYRRYISSKSKTDPFYINLKKRIQHRLDPTSKVHQIQSPLETGQSTNLSARMAAHQPKTQFASATKSYALTFAYLKVLDIPTESVCLPLARALTPSQISMAEIVFTLLGSSLAEQYGFNPKQAGNTEHDLAPLTLDEEDEEVFINHTWFEDNLKSSIDTMVTRNASLELVERRADRELERKIADTKNSIQTVTASFNFESAKLPQTFVITQQRIDVLKEQIEIARIERNNRRTKSRSATSWRLLSHLGRIWLETDSCLHLLKSYTMLTLPRCCSLGEYAANAPAAST